MRPLTLGFVLLTFLTNANALAVQRVRKIHLKRDDIALVHTAIGIATLIQVPDRPSSVVLGDTNAFKVEYLENAITIKPLSRLAKSNLYIYTDARRYNVSLVTAPSASADYIVYLEPEIVTVNPVRQQWRDYRAHHKNRDFELSISRIGRSGNLWLVAFQISTSKTLTLNPGWIWLKQNRRTIPIQDLNLSSLQISKNAPVSGVLSVRLKDISRTLPLVLEFRSRVLVLIRLPEIRSWLKSS